MNINNASTAPLINITMWANLNYNRIEDYLVREDAVLYVIDGKYRFLALGEWAWDMQNKKEMTEMLEDYKLFCKPRGVPKSAVVRALCGNIWYRKVLREIVLTRPVSRRRGSKIAEYREDLRQYIQNTYYPI